MRRCGEVLLRELRPDEAEAPLPLRELPPRDEPDDELRLPVREDPEPERLRLLLLEERLALADRLVLVDRLLLVDRLVLARPVRLRVLVAR